MKNTSLIIFVLLFSFGLNGQRSNDIKIGLHVGTIGLVTDVSKSLVNGFGLGAKVILSDEKIFGLRLNYLYAKGSGISAQPWTHHNIDGKSVNEIGGGLVEVIYEDLDPMKGLSDGFWFPTFKTSTSNIEIEGTISIVRFINKMTDHIADNEAINFYIIGGLGYFSYNTKLNLYNANDRPYTDLINSSGFTYDLFNTKSGRAKIIKNLREIYDDSYESNISKYSINANKVFSGGGGLSFKIGEKIDLYFEYKRIIYKNQDYLDGIRFRTEDELTQNSDAANYISVMFGYAL